MMSLLNFNLPVYNSPKSKQRRIGVFYLLAVMFTPMPICWKRCINPLFALLGSVSRSVCASVCVWCQSDRRLVFHLCTQDQGEECKPYTLYSPTLLAVSAGLISEEGHLFYPRNQTGMKQSRLSEGSTFL